VTLAGAFSFSKSHPQSHLWLFAGLNKPQRGHFRDTMFPCLPNVQRSPAAAHNVGAAVWCNACWAAYRWPLLASRSVTSSSIGNHP